MNKINLSFFIILVSLIALTISYGAEGDSKKTDIVGKKEFMNYCASCHGSSGKGDGPIVHYLKRKPIDLTQLSKNNGNSFPFDRIYGVFDGTYIFAEHGTSEMPIWGYRFIREAQQENEPSNVAKAKALDIILYIQVIQE
ncbi:MAG: c-type cytochrome [Gammaproteobacteria bacterium]